MLQLPMGSTGGPVGADHCLVAHPRVGDRAGATWVWAQCGPNRGSAICPLDPSAPDLGVTGVEHYSVGCP
jgi:hypothetical protein